MLEGEKVQGKIFKIDKRLAEATDERRDWRKPLRKADRAQRTQKSQSCYAHHNRHAIAYLMDTQKLRLHFSELKNTHNPCLDYFTELLQ